MKSKKIMMILAAVFLMSFCFAAACDTPVTYVVSFSNAGDTAIASQNVKANEKATKPADPQKEGSKFGGWFKDADCTQAFDFDEPITADTVVYIKWDVVNRETIVTYDYQNGIGTETGIVVTYGTEFTMTVPTREGGYRFLGWYAQPKGKGNKYTDEYGKSIVLWPETAATKIVYAHWFDENGEPDVHARSFKKAPDITVYTLDNSTPVKLSDYYGDKPVFLSLWETT